MLLKHILTFYIMHWKDSSLAISKLWESLCVHNDINWEACCRYCCRDDFSQCDAYFIMVEALVGVGARLGHTNYIMST